MKTPVISQPKFPLSNPRHHSDDREDGGHDYNRQPNVQCILVETRLDGGGHGGQGQNQNDIAAGAMVFVNRLCVVDRAEERWGVILGDTDDGLNEEEDVHNHAEDVMRSAKVGAIVSELVVFDDDEPADKGQDADPVDDGVDLGAFSFLPRRVGGLEKQDCLGVEKKTGQVKKLSRTTLVSKHSKGELVWGFYRVEGEEGQGGEEDIGPHSRRQLENVSLDVSDDEWKGPTSQIPACAMTAVPGFHQRMDVPAETATSYQG